MTYVAFDVLAVDGQCLTQHIFDQAESAGHPGPRHAVTELPIFKQWVVPNQIQRCLERQMGVYRGVRTYRSGGVCHGSDGYILQPTQTPFVIGTDMAMFKYKAPKDLTLDLCIDVELLRKGHHDSPACFLHGEKARAPARHGQNVPRRFDRLIRRSQHRHARGN